MARIGGDKMKYDPSLGIIGNLKCLFDERNKTNNKVFNNKAEADEHITNLEELCVDHEYKLTLMELDISE